ncbi:MAG: MBL fold metallo-hydrolase [Actinomycetota bacterium]|nr:MBL fold metallo-hydrolase [Actinomycetota bacterium]
MALIKRILPGLYKIRLAMPFRMDQVNVYLLEGDPLTLVDTGPVMEGTWDDLEEALRRTGHEPGRLERVIVTHTHPDHMGMAARLVEASCAELICHRLAVPKMTDYRGTVLREMEDLIRISRTLGLSPDLMRTNQSMMNRWLYVAESTRVDTIVEGGEVLEGNPFRLEVIYTPGHCLDHIVLYIRDYRLILTGDLLLDKITPNPDIYPDRPDGKQSGLPDFLDSISRLADLPVVQALPGHGNCISNFRGRIEDIHIHHEQRKRYIVANLRGREMTILEMGLDLIRFVDAETSPTNIFLAMREILGHLVILEEEGLVVKQVRDGTNYYRVED